MRKVVQFSTGNVGRYSLAAIIGRPDLKLVGVHASGPDKIGRDAAERCGLDEPTGVIATGDIDALIALSPDCVVYTALGETDRWRPSRRCRGSCRRGSTSSERQWCGW